MAAVNATIRNRQIVSSDPIDLPDGTVLRIEYTPIGESIGMTEAEWSDEPAALADWSAWLAAIEPVEFAADTDFDEEYRRFNTEAVRQQMAEEQ